MIAYTGEKSNIFHKGHEDAHRNHRYVAVARNAIEEMGERLRDESFGEYLAIRGKANAPYEGHALQEEFLCDTFGAYVYDKVFDSNMAWLGCGVNSTDLQSYFDLEFDKATGEAGALSVQDVAGETMASSNDPLKTVSQNESLVNNTRIFNEDEYNRFGWVVDNGIISDKEFAEFFSRLSDKQNHKLINRTKDGNDAIAVDNDIGSTVIINNGDYETPSIIRTYSIFGESETDIEYIRRYIWYREKSLRKSSV